LHQTARNSGNAAVSRRIKVLLPNSEATRSTATAAVRLRTSSEGFDSMMSSEPNWPVSTIISADLVRGAALGRSCPEQVTLFDSVGFALEDYSALRFLHCLLKEERGGARQIDLVIVTLYTTNGRWDLVAEIRADSLQSFDQVLSRIIRIEGISGTETSLLLSTHEL